MGKVKVTIHCDDYFSYRMRTPIETVDMFGEDYLADYGVDIPEEVLEEYKELMVKYRAMQALLKKIKQDSEK